MAMIYKNTEDKTDLQRRIAADLQTKNSATLVDKEKISANPVNVMERDDFAKSSPIAMTILLLLGLIVVVCGVLMYLSGHGA